MAAITFAAPALTTVSSFTGARVASRAARGGRARGPNPRAARPLTVRAATIEEDELRAKYPDGGPVFSVSVDCRMGTNSTGIVMKEGPEGRPEVSIVRPGGTAKNKLKIGDVCLATNYTELVDAGPGSYGTPNVGWFDTEGEPYVNSICAMVDPASLKDVF